MSETSESAAITDAALHQIVWNRLKELGIKELAVTFSGGGDSGQIDEIAPQYGTGVDAEMHAAQCEAFAACRIEPVKVGDTTINSLTKLVEHLADDLLAQDKIPDWWNNEGGNGEIVWTVATETIECTVNQAMITYDTSTFYYDKNGEASDEQLSS